MTWTGRLRAEGLVAWRSFFRRRTAVFFTFLFPVILVVIFGGLVGSTAGGALFSEPPAYYVPGYLATVVLFTPLSRLSSTVARHREGHRFEKLATTPLTPLEWLLAHGLVNTVLVGLSGLLVLGLVAYLTEAAFTVTPWLVGFVVFGTGVFVGLGTVIGRVAGTQDGAVAASNAIGLPLLFLSDTFVPPAVLPAWFEPLVALSPLTYFARGARATMTGTPGWPSDLIVLAVLAVVAVGIAIIALPYRT